MVENTEVRINRLLDQMEDPEKTSSEIKQIQEKIEFILELSNK